MPTSKKSDAVNGKIVRELQKTLAYLGADPALADRPGMYQKLEALGADRELLAVVGSWGDTLDDEEVLVLLKEWNAAESKARRN
jgi:hypothetical protein